MPGSKNYQKLRIFLASPGDVAKERDAVRAVVAELNKTGSGLADSLGIQFEVIGYDTHVAPDMGRPQGVVFNQLPPESWDIFIGILWQRFGSPTGEIDPQTGKEFESGSVEEFSRAYELWKQHGAPRIFFYRSKQTIDYFSLKPEQKQALEKIENFFAQFGPRENHPGYYRAYQTPEDFEKAVRQDLNQFLMNYRKEERQLPAAPPRESLEILRRRYLEKLQVACNLLPLAAIAKGSDPHASLRLTLDKVYIGLNTTQQVGKDGKPLQREMNPREEARALTALEAAANESMLVILGDPGSGKSSFINHLLWQLAERQLRPASTLLQDWPPRDCFPIRILLRELLVTLQKETPPQNLEARQRHFCGLVQQHLRRKLEKDGLADFAPALENLIADGRGLIVFDGLDEAPPEQRELLRDAVECFCADSPANRFLVTCRVLSYVEKAVLPSFNRVELAPFDKKQINEFISRWYQALQQLGKPEDWANAKTADLQQAVQKLPPSMVRNPLLLTTLAGIHATNVELPRQRVKLYQLAGAMLLRRWQEAKADRVSLFEEIGLADENKMLHALWELGHFGQNAGRAQEAAADIPRKEALNILERNFAGVPKPGIAANLFLDYADQTAGLLSGRGGPGERVYAFPHRTFQEYFAGCYLAKRTRDFKRAVKQRLAEGDYWRLAAQLGLEEVLHNDGREYEALEAAYFLCPATLPAQETDWRGVLWAGHFAATIGPGAMAKDREGDGPSFLQRLRERLTTILTQSLLPARERADAGFVLNQLGDEREGVCTLPPVWVELPGGTFRMGSDDGEDLERPPHEVEVSPFKISKYPITNAQFEKFVQAGGYDYKDWWSEEGWKYRQEENWEAPRWWRDENFNLPNQPVVGVSWFEAEAFCNWLTAKGEERGVKGEIVRLPTEAEWEFAARGTEGRKFPWGKDEPTPEQANFDQSQIGRPTAVGTYRLGATPEGIFDLAGNVWEWCLDWHDENYYTECKKKGVVKNPVCTKESWGRVLRGASWYNDATALRGARRVWNYPGGWVGNDGFRVCVGGES